MTVFWDPGFSTPLSEIGGRDGEEQLLMPVIFYSVNELTVNYAHRGCLSSL